MLLTNRYLSRRLFRCRVLFMQSFQVGFEWYVFTIGLKIQT